MFESCLRNFQKPDQNGRASFVCSSSLFTCSRSQFFLRFALKASLWAERESCLRNFQKPDRFLVGLLSCNYHFFPNYSAEFIAKTKNNRKFAGRKQKSI